MFNINRTKLEQLIHRVFAAARLDLTITDRFGHPVQPREWFLVPLSIIDEVVERIKNETIAGLSYDPQAACLVRLDGALSVLINRAQNVAHVNENYALRGASAPCAKTGYGWIGI